MWSRTWLRTNSEDTSLWNADDLDSLFFIYKGPGFYELSIPPVPHPQQRFQLMLILLSSAPEEGLQVESATEPQGSLAVACLLMRPSPSEFPVTAPTNCHNRMPSNSGVLSPHSLGGQKPVGHSQGAGRAAPSGSSRMFPGLFQLLGPPTLLGSCPLPPASAPAAAGLPSSPPPSPTFTGSCGSTGPPGSPRPVS